MVKKNKKAKWYAVSCGRRTGIFTSWDECKAQVHRFEEAVYKSFGSEGEARSFLAAPTYTSRSRGSRTDDVNHKRAKRARFDVSNAEDESKPLPPPASSSSPFVCSASSTSAACNERASSTATANHSTIAPDSSVTVHEYHNYTDGGSRGNPGPAGGGVVIYQMPGFICLWRASYWLGTKTNNHAEYMAICRALEAVPTLELQQVPVIVYTDSKLALEQLRGNWKINNKDLRVLHQRATKAGSRLHRLEFRKVKGHSGDAGNEEADRLVNLAMDTQRDSIEIVHS